MKKLFAILAIAALGCVLPAAADVITLTGTSGNSQGGVYTVPYLLSVNGGASFAAMCVDFDHHASVGESWDGSVTDMSGDLSDTRLGNSGYDTYREEAWLYSEFQAGAGPSGDINFAAWALTSPDAKTSSGWTAGAQYWYNQATTVNLSSFNTSSFNIITPADLSSSGSQEFVTETPEPAGLVLVGSGLLGLAGLGRRKMRRL